MAAKYWYQSGADAHWNTVTGNWWNDAAHTSQAASIPVNTNDVYLLGSVAPDTSPSAVTLHRLDTSGLNANLTAAGCDLSAISIAKGLNPQFGVLLIGASGYNHEFGGSTTSTANTCTFQYGAAFNSGTIQGNATFNNSWMSGGTINGTATFNGGDAGGGTIATAIFNSATASGNINIGTATFNTSGGITSSSAYITTATFNGSTYTNSPFGYVEIVTATFNDTSYATNAHIGTGTFNDSSYATGCTITVGNFYDQSYADSVTSSGDLYFYDDSYPTNCIVSVAIIYGNPRTIIDAFAEDTSNDSASINANVPDIVFQYLARNWVYRTVTVNGDCSFTGSFDFGSSFYPPSLSGDNTYTNCTFTSGTFDGDATVDTCTIYGGTFNAACIFEDCSPVSQATFASSATITAKGSTWFANCTFSSTNTVVFAADSTAGYSNASETGNTWGDTIKAYAKAAVGGVFQSPTTIYFYSQSDSPKVTAMTSGIVKVTYSGPLGGSFTFC